MVSMTLDEVRAAVRSPRDPEKPLPDVSVSAVSTDTRAIEAGSLFVALRGENFDGHDFLQAAEQAGAAAAIVEAEGEVSIPQIVVPDTRRSLGDLALAHRRRLKGCKVIAVAGSNGKTTTKRLIHAALSQKLTGTVSPASFNNDIGVPLTLLPAKASDDFVILECGTNHPGEIERLSKISEPDVAVITSIGEEHLEGLGDLQGVRRENMAITEGMNAKGLLIVHGDDKPLAALAKGFAGRVATFGVHDSNDLWAKDIVTSTAGVSFKLNGSRTQVNVPLLGRHNATNALAAIAVARRLGLDDDTMLTGLLNAEGPAMRMQRSVVGGVTILNDAYNANPASMKAALELFGETSCEGRKIAVLGDMLELGGQFRAYHEAAGAQVKAAKVDALVTVGEAAKHIGEGAKVAGFAAGRVMHVADAATAARTFASGLQSGDLVLLKGSRGMKLEIIAEAIEAARG